MECSLLLHKGFIVLFQTEDIESKLDLLIDLYKEDRKLLMGCYQNCVQNTRLSQPTQEVTSCLKNSSATLKQPRSVLVDKSNKQSSTSNMHEDDFNPAYAMHRNLSDLGQRIKKRVTYRLMSLNDDGHRNRHSPPESFNYKGRRKSASFDTGDELYINNQRSTLFTSQNAFQEDLLNTEEIEEHQNEEQSFSSDDEDTEDKTKKVIPNSESLTREIRRERFLRERFSRSYRRTNDDNSDNDTDEEIDSDSSCEDREAFA